MSSSSPGIKASQGISDEDISRAHAALSGDRETVEVEAEFTYQDGRTGKTKTALKIATIGEGDR